jgi:ParB-like chromosome segregation protein Spo0J
MATKKIEEIQTHPLFEGLFTINDELLAKIEQNMRDDNYDESQPIILATWPGQEEHVCIDGHTRLKAATKAGIEEVAVYSYEFESEEDAFEYAIRLQSNRRNLTDGDLIQCIERLHQRRPRGGDRRSDAAMESTPQSCGKQNGRSAAAKQTGDLLNISARKVEQVLTIIKHGRPEVKEAVLKNEISINGAYQKTQKDRKQAEAESSAEVSEKKASEESQEGEQADEGLISKFHASVFISMEHLGALHELGGLAETHLAKAIDLYLESLAERHEDIPAEKDQEHVKDDEDDDEEYLDLDEYGDE